MNIAKMIALLLTAAEQAISFAKELRANSGMTDDALRAQIANEDDATRKSIDKFLGQFNA